MKVLAALIGLSAVTVVGCATAKAPRVDYPQTANPVAEYESLAQEVNIGVSQHYDVLAERELEGAQKHLDEAKDELGEQGDPEEFWEEMAYARGHLAQARDLSAARAPQVAEVLEARRMAWDAGARRGQDSAKELKNLDDRFRRAAKRLDHDEINPGLWDDLRKGYRALEIASIQDSKLRDTRALIAEAQKNGARRYAKRTLAEAQSALRAAERSVAENPRDVRAHAPSVEKAQRMGRVLAAVNATARKAAKQSDEQVAREIVMRNQAITALESEVVGAELEADLATQALAGKDAEARGLAMSNRALMSEAEWNRALEDARSRFSEDEAEVYRQGDRLVVRLRKVQFPTGSAQVPAPSRAVLAKVTGIIDELNATAVEVQGHTDSTGGAKVNKKISTQRAKSVARLIQSEVEDTKVNAVGYGYEKPLASNKSATGRATNRRVDIVITPVSGAMESETDPDAVSQ